MKALKTSWKNKAISSEKEKIPLEGFYTDVEAEAIGNGLIPESMDDKWFIYTENSWVNFHRSWSGQCIFMLKLEASPTGVRVAEAWVSRDSSQYQSPGVDAELETLTNLIMKLLNR